MSTRPQFIMWYLSAFDGRSADVDALTASQRWCWVALCGFVREYLPRDGTLNIGIEDGELVPASLRRLARYGMVAPSTMSGAIEVFEARGMLRRDRRKTNPCWVIPEWEKWQHNGGKECSGAEQSGVREPNTTPFECSGAEQECSGAEQECSGAEQECSGAEHLSGGAKCSGAEHYPDASQGAQGLRAEVSDGAECSGAEHTQETYRSTDINDSVRTDRFRSATADIFAQVGIDEQMFDVLWMGITSSNHSHFEAVVIEAATQAAQWAFDRERIEGRLPKPQSISNWFRKALRSLNEEEAERDALHDDTDRLFIRLVGPKPRDGSILKKQEWDEELRQFRRDQELYLWSKCGSGGWPRVEQRAKDLGLWDDGLPERVMERLRSGDYIEELQP